MLQDEAIKINPRYAEAYYNLGNIYRESADYKKSIEFYKNAISIKPNYVSALINLSISLNKNGNLKEAARNLYTTLRKIKKDRFKSIAIEKIPNKGLGKTINDRLLRASKF